MKVAYAVLPQYAHFFADNMRDEQIINLIENYEAVVFELYKRFDDKGVEYTSDMKELRSWIEEDEKSDRTVNSLQALNTENMLHQNLLQAIDGVVVNTTMDLFNKELHKGNSRHYKQTKLVNFIKQLAKHKAKEEPHGFLKDFYFIFVESDTRGEKKRELVLQLFANNLIYFK